MLLADVFETFISTCLEYYRSDPCYYFRIELKLILNIDMYLFIEKSMRGGISYIAKRYSKANNKYIQSYDNKKTSCI